MLIQNAPRRHHYVEIKNKCFNDMLYFHQDLRRNRQEVPIVLIQKRTTSPPFAGAAELQGGRAVSPRREPTQDDGGAVQAAETGGPDKLPYPQELHPGGRQVNAG